MSSTSQITVVIPGRNVARYAPQCLDAIGALDDASHVAEIIFVDDASTDETKEIIAKYEVRCLSGAGQGPAAARNVGWRAAKTELVWFLDADCVPHADALGPLLAALKNAQVGAVGSTFRNATKGSLLADLIDVEIIVRHRDMPAEVNYLASGSLLCRCEVVEQLDGFDPSLRTAEDTDFSYRVRKAGYQLRFAGDSIVLHHHTRSLRVYLRAQRMHGCNRMLVYRRHPDRATGDHYSGLLDYLQPPLAMLTLALLPLAVFPWGKWLAPAALSALVLAQLPLTLRVIATSGRLAMLSFALLGTLRSFWRGWGMCWGVLKALCTANTPPTSSNKNESDTTSVESEVAP